MAISKGDFVRVVSLNYASLEELQNPMLLGRMTDKDIEQAQSGFDSFMKEKGVAIGSTGQIVEIKSGPHGFASAYAVKFLLPDGRHFNINLRPHMIEKIENK